MSLAQSQPTLRRDRQGRVESFVAADAVDRRTAESGTCIDDLGREVYCVLGMPIDAVAMTTALARIDAAAVNATPYLISTPNLHFLVSSRSDEEFRESLLDSDLCPADGMPIVWIGRLLGAPIKKVSGSDIFEALKAPSRLAHRLSVFLFGGAEGVARAAANALNSRPGGLSCVGTISPGFGSVDQMSHRDINEAINASDADLLEVSLGAKKGQAWLRRNHQRLTTPIRVHLGAVVNFQAGTIRRAPSTIQALGLEWLWRIKEEPHLWRRYWHDGCRLLDLLLTRVLPLAIANRWDRFRSERWPRALQIKTAHHHDCVMVSLSGDATERYIGRAMSSFRETLTPDNNAIIVDLSSTRVIDVRFFGLLLMLRKRLKRRGAQLTFVGASPAIKHRFWLNELSFLLASK